MPGFTTTKDLAIWLTGYDPTPVLLPLCAHLRLERLSVSFEPLLGPGRGLRGHARHSTFSRLTHLEVIHDCNNWEEWKDLAKLPCLTNLSLTLGTSLDIVSGALSECPHLRILARVTQGFELEDSTCHLRSSMMEATYAGIDPRLVEFECGYLEDWKAFAFGEPNMWTIAELVVEYRLREMSAAVVDI